MVLNITAVILVSQYNFAYERLLDLGIYHLNIDGILMFYGVQFFKVLEFTLGLPLTGGFANIGDEYG
jgi:hypothetical protein